MANNDSSKDLQNIGSLAAIGGLFYLGSLNDKIKDINKSLDEQRKDEAQQNILRDFVFNVNQFIDKEFPKIKNKKYGLVVVIKILNSIKKMNITTKSFNKIEDKEYFSGVIDKMNSIIKENEKYEEVATHISNIYSRYQALLLLSNYFDKMHRIANSIEQINYSSVAIYILCFIITLLIYSLVNQDAEIITIFVGLVLFVIAYLLISGYSNVRNGQMEIIENALKPQLEMLDISFSKKFTILDHPRYNYNEINNNVEYLENEFTKNKKLIRDIEEHNPGLNDIYNIICKLI